jgi:hypothetical protein
MSSNPTLAKDDLPESWPAVAAGLVIFLSAGWELILNELPYELHQQLFNPSHWFYFLSPAVGFAAAWVLRFPRWSYPYIPIALLLPLYLSNASTPGLTLLGFPTFGEELWGWRAFIPVLVGGAIAWLITRSLAPWRKFFSQIGQDWTLGTYALSGTLPLLIFIAYDEMDRVYSLLNVSLLSAALIAMAVIYLRSRTFHRRRLTVVAGILTILGYTAVTVTVYWFSLGPDNVNILGMILWTIILVAFYLYPGIHAAAIQRADQVKP